MPRTSPNRRTFLKTSAATAAALAAPMFISARGANEKLNIAMIGSGGRGGANLKGVEGENIVALCDVDKNAVEKAAENISEGQSIAVPLKNSGQFPPLVTHMITIGEKTGELERMLTVVADAYEDQVEATITAMTSLLGPAMIMLIGGIVFIVALGLLTPMMNISSMIK